MSHYVDFNATQAFFAETFQPMNAALKFQIGLNQIAHEQFKCAADLESFQ